MKVSAILDSKGRQVHSTGPGVSLALVASRLQAEKIGALVVLDGERLAGIVSERDVVRAFASRSGDAAGMQVDEVMTRQVLTCAPDDSLTDVLRLMTRHRVRHLPVMQGGRLVGLVSIGDAVKHRLAELELETTVLREAYIAAG